MKHLLSTIFILIFSFVVLSQDKSPMIEPCKATNKNLPLIHGLKFGMSYAEVKAILPTLTGDEYTKNQRVVVRNIKNPAFSDISSIDFEFFNDRAIVFDISYNRSTNVYSIDEYRDKLSDLLNVPVEHWEIMMREKNGGTVELNCYDFTLHASAEDGLKTQDRRLLIKYVGRTALVNSKP